MTVLTWDGVGQKFYETGLDRGVFYLEDGTGIPWNGLTSVEEKFTAGPSGPVYFDGVKINEVVSVSDFAATLKAITYPDEFMEYEGVQESSNGMLVTSQVPKLFGLSWRTKVGNDVNAAFGYKIHIAANITAVAAQRSYETNSSSPSMVEFEWNLTSIPSKIPGFRPTSHLIFDTSKSQPEFVSALEAILYGDEINSAYLPSLGDLVNTANIWTA